ncbi:MAG: ABC transporter substrate-binding protein [Desulfurococcales archaeon]|nr:ABC transporter substrate-binding protein [Desulfurococcales archaeon]
MNSKVLGGIVLIVIIILAGFFLLGGREGETTTTGTTGATTPAEKTETTPTGEAPKEITINVGLLVDETGPTSDVGKGYSLGAETAFKYFNDKGIYTKDGVKVNIKYIKRDYAYKPDQAEAFYKEFRDKYGVIAIIGWGTADTEKLADTVAKDKIAYISASYSAKLTVKPYNFFPAPDYSTQACAGIAWASQFKPGGKLALLYDHKVAYSRSPIPAVKAVAQALGMQLVGDFDLSLKATEASAERVISDASTKNPDIFWCGNTISSCSLAVKAMYKLGVDAMLLSNVWGFDERVTQLVGEAGYGRMAGVTPFVYPMFADELGADGIKILREAAKAAGVPEDKIDLRFTQGFLNVWLLVQAIERTDSKSLQEKGGEAIKEALESSCNGEPFKFGGLTADDVRFCPNNHVAHSKVYIVEFTKEGKLKIEGPYQAPKEVDCVKVTIEQG